MEIVTVGFKGEIYSQWWNVTKYIYSITTTNWRYFGSIFSFFFLSGKYCTLLSDTFSCYSILHFFIPVQWKTSISKFRFTFRKNAEFCFVLFDILKYQKNKQKSIIFTYMNLFMHIYWIRWLNQFIDLIFSIFLTIWISVFLKLTENKLHLFKNAVLWLWWRM